MILVVLITAVFILLLILLGNIYEVKKKSNTISLSAIFFLIIIMVLIPMAAILVLTCSVYRVIIYLILKMKYGSIFGGLVKGADAFYTMDEPSNNVINILIMWQDVTQKSSEDVYNKLQTIAYNLISVTPVCSSIFLKYAGYTYKVKQEVPMDDCVRKMKIVTDKNKIEKDELIKSITECYNSPLPKNGTVWAEAVVGTQPVNWRNDGKIYYPLLFRIHHGLCDGVTLLKVLIGSYSDKQNLPDLPNICNETNKLPNQRHNLLITRICMVMLVPASLYLTFVFKAKDCNTLRGPTLKYQSNVAMNAEEHPGYVQQIKRIKNKIPGISFSDVLLTAFSASLAEYFEKNSTSAPEFVTAAVPLRSTALELNTLNPGQLDVNSITMENSHSMVLMNIPIIIKEKDGSQTDFPLIKRLKLVNKESMNLRHSIDSQVNHILMLLCGVVPELVIKFIASIARCTTLISIVPGTQKVTYNQGSLVLTDILFWIPHLYKIGVGFSALTYDGRLQVGLKVDTALIPDEESVHAVLDGVYKNLDLLEKDSACIENNNFVQIEIA